MIISDTPGGMPGALLRVHFGGQQSRTRSHIDRSVLAKSPWPFGIRYLVLGIVTYFPGPHEVGHLRERLSWQLQAPGRVGGGALRRWSRAPTLVSSLPAPRAARVRP